MKKVTCLTITLILAFATYMDAQEQSFTDSKAIYEKVAELNNAEKYTEVIEELKRIPSYDSTYEDAALELVKAYLNAEKWQESIALCDWGIANKGDRTNLFFQYKGVAYSKMGEQDKALDIYAKGLVLFPMHHSLKYNSAVVFKRKGEHARALEQLQAVLMSSPYMKRAHLDLGLMAIKENETARAMMSLNTYLFLEGNATTANNILSYLNTFVTAKKDSVPHGLFKSGQENFDKLNLLLDNYLAMDKGYKTGLSINVAAIKQNHLLFTELSKTPYSENGFWNKFYVPIFQELVKAEQFENYSYYLLQASTNDAHKKLVAKRLANIKQFGEWSNDYLSKTWNIARTANSNGQFALKVFHNDEVTKGEGFIDKKTNKLEGPWKEYSKSGALLADGAYKLGEREGHWVWYHPNGRISREGDLKDGKFNGLVTSYHSNGKKRIQGNYITGDKDGLHEEFHANGNMAFRKGYKTGKPEGVSMKYDGNGTLIDSLFYVDGLAEGEYRYYYPDGTLKIVGNATNDNRNGRTLHYHRNGKLKSDYNYVDGKLEGEGKEYFEDGQLSYEASYRNDKRIGKQRSFRNDGTLIYESQYDDSGNENGGRTYFDTQNRPHETYVYVKGLITAYQFYDKSGKVTHEAKKKGNEFEYRGAFFDGTLSSVGLYDVKGGREGYWEFYNKDGILKSRENYKQNEQEGNQTYYHPNGKVREEYTVKDGQAVGESKEYHINGKLQEHGRFEAGERTGEWFYYNADGSLNQLEYYIKGSLVYRMRYSVEGSPNVESFYTNDILDKITYYGNDGVAIDTFYFDGGNGALDYRFANGNLQVVGSNTMGMRHGPYSYLHFDGRIASKGAFHSGDYHGTWKDYHANGQLSEDAEYFFGDRHGKYTSWDWFGTKSSEGEYSYGNKVGIWKHYYANGMLEETIEYLFGNQHGKREFFAPTGDLQMIRYYDNGVLTSYSYHDSNGKPVPPISVNRAKDRIVAYFPNGKVSREYILDRGMIQGEFKEYLPTGNLAYNSNYVDGDAMGKRTEYYASGKVYAEGEFLYDEKHGPQIIYWENGKKRLEIPYVLGNPHGIGREYDNTGKLKVEYEFDNNQLLGEKKL